MTWVWLTAGYLVVGFVLTFLIGVAYVKDRTARRDRGETEEIDPSLPRDALIGCIVFWPLLAAYILVATVLRWTANLVKKALEWKTGEKL